VRPRVGIQLYSLRELTAVDFEGALESVAALGYDGVEFAGLLGNRPAAIRAVLDRTGLGVAGAHVSLGDLEERFVETIDDLHALGCPAATLAWLEPERYADEATARDTVRRLVAAGERVRAAGFGFAYHNHDFEFGPIVGRAGARDERPIDERQTDERPTDERAGAPAEGRAGATTLWSLLTEQPPDALPFEIDVYWVRHAGLDPAELIHELGSRVAFIHAKDTAADLAGDCPVGDGIERWPDLLSACRDAGVPWVIVEQEHAADILADAGTSLRNLRQLLG